MQAVEEITEWEEIKDLVPYAGVTGATLRNWIVFGHSTPTGRVKLKAQRNGGQWRSTREAIDEFRDALTRAYQGEPISETPAAVERRAKADQERARKKLGGKKQAS